MACNQEEYYALIQGTDTTFGGNHFIYDYIATNLDLTGYTAICEVPKGHFSKDLSFSYSTEREQWYVVIDFTAEETNKMPLGTQQIVVVIYNPDGLQYSLEGIPVKVLKRGISSTNILLDQTIVIGDGGQIQQIVKTPPYSHAGLVDRDLSDQHPIEAITGLQDTLSNMDTAISGKLDKVVATDKVYGTDENGEQTLYDKNSFGQVDDVTVGGTSVVTNKTAILGTMAGEETTSYPKKTELATVAFDGSYTSLSDKPTIGEGVLTFQKNNTTIDTFSANATSGKTINISVPTSAEDVNALPNTTKYASAVDLSLNETTYELTIQLKDQNGDNIGNTKSIDLPIESVVVSGSYDAETQEVVLTLQGGSTIRFSVASLVSGLQTEISATNKISSDFVDDTEKAHKFVSSQEKATWNGKQNAITNTNKLSASLVDGLAQVATSGNASDLTTDSTHLLVTATEKENWNNKQPAITTSNKLTSDLVDDTNSTNKFVTATEKSTWNNKQDALTQGAGIAIAGTTISNSGVRSVGTGTTNGTISVNTNGTSTEVAVAGLDTAAFTPATEFATSAQGTKADTAIQGVQINGTDLTKDVNNKVDIPKASNSTLGVVQTNGSYGIEISSNGYIATIPAAEATLVAKLNGRNVVVANNLDLAVREGLGNNGLTWTDAYKISACQTIGTVSGVQINGTDLTPDSTTNKVDIPIGDGTNLGVGKFNSSYGLASYGAPNGYVYVVKATEANLIAKTNNYNAVVSSNLDIAIREGLGNNALTWTEAYKTSARNTIGATRVSFVDWTD